MDAVSRRGLAAALVGAVLATAYAFSFVFAQGTPSPHELPVAVAGPSAQVATLARRIERSAGDAYEVRRFDGERSARRALRDGDIYVAILVGDGPVRLLTASALGRTAVQGAVMELPKHAGLPAMPLPQVEEIRPLVGEDPQGTVLNVQLFPPIILGLVVPILLLLIAPALTVRQRLGAVSLFALLAGVGTMLMTNVALSALPGSFLALTGISILLAFAIASCVTGSVGAVGPPGIGVGVLLFLIIGNVASGASVQHEELPGFYRVVGPYLPPGAGADALRSVAYFDGSNLLRPLLVLGGFGLLGATLCLAFGSRRPAPQGDPSGPTADQDVARTD